MYKVGTFVGTLTHYENLNLFISWLLWGLVRLHGLAIHRLTCPELPMTSRVLTSGDRGRQGEMGHIYIVLYA